MRQRLRRESEGVVAVEFALILPILAILVFGIIEFGMLFRANLTVSQAARAGARTAAAQPRILGYQTNSASAVAASLRNTLSTEEITYLSIYRANKITGLPADGSSYKTCTTCYRFSWDPATKTWTQLGGAAWPAASQQACGSEALTDYLGVYVEAKYTWVTGLFRPVFGSASLLQERTVMRLEPIGSQTACS